MSTADDISDKVEFRDIVIVGGGCYGTFYAGQLARARARGRVSYQRLLVVDRDSNCRISRELDEDPKRQLVVREWGDFFDDYLAGTPLPDNGSSPDAIVPSPLMPHLMYEWLVRRARSRWPGRPIETRPFTADLETPYETSAPDGTRYVSFADWICPTHCIEPAVCPVIRAPRAWEMADAMTGWVRRLNLSTPTAGPVLFVCEHRVFGVGMFDVGAVLAGDAAVAAAGESKSPVDVVVGTISRCHGAVNLLRLA
ncbi:MAG TPA: hypothetical protein VFH26_10930 [Gemmatimonadales bacterium]|nr:hypothetical protein [Gemmatimonadales bacterium]